MITDKYQNTMFSYTGSPWTVVASFEKKYMKCQRHHRPNYNCTSYKVAFHYFSYCFKDNCPYNTVFKNFTNCCPALNKIVARAKT